MGCSRFRATVVGKAYSTLISSDDDFGRVGATLVLTRAFERRLGRCDMQCRSTPLNSKRGETYVNRRLWLDRLMRDFYSAWVGVGGIGNMAKRKRKISSRQTPVRVRLLIVGLIVVVAIPTPIAAAHYLSSSMRA